MGRNRRDQQNKIKSPNGWYESASLAGQYPNHHRRQCTSTAGGHASRSTVRDTPTGAICISSSSFHTQRPNSPPNSPCHQLQIRHPHNPTSKPSSTQPWPSMPDALVKISATTRWLPPSIDAPLRMRLCLYSKRNPKHLMNSGMAIPS